jgi:probable dihydroxyacetone kinase regulator
MKQEEISRRTKEKLAASLKKTMQKKPFSKITVSEIIADCNINRKTFYYHFEDIYDLLTWMFREEALEVVRHFDFIVDYEEALNFVIDYVEENNYIISCAYDSVGNEQMKRFFYDDFYGITAAIIEQFEQQHSKTIGNDYKVFLTKFYTEALANILIDWVKKP